MRSVTLDHMSAPATQSRTDAAGMRLVRVDPRDRAAVTASVDLLNTAQRVDDPDGHPGIPELAAGWLEFGWDLEPDERYLYLAEGSDAPVAVFEIQLPTRDNRHLVWGSIVVRPDLRRLGHGSALVAELVRRAEESGRTTIWLGCAEDDLGARAFLEAHGFHYASHDARRKQILPEIDHEAIERCTHRPSRRPPTTCWSDWYRRSRTSCSSSWWRSPRRSTTLRWVTSPSRTRCSTLLGCATSRRRAKGRGDRLYRIAARHRQTGVIGGHTVVGLHPLDPTHAGQGDTAVHRDHRGHRLGLLLKIEMMRWLAESEPQITEITTWNHADNRYMIDVNEAIGYRLSRVFAMYERSL